MKLPAFLRRKDTDSIGVPLGDRQPIPPSVEATIRKTAVDASQRLGNVEITADKRDNRYRFVNEAGYVIEFEAALVESGYYSMLDLSNAIVAAFDDGGC